MEKHEKTTLLTAAIMTNAATAQGFSVTDCPSAATTKAAHQRCRLMIIAGTPFKARVHYRLIRYFLTAEAAKQFVRENADKALERAGSSMVLKPKPTFSEVQFQRSAANKAPSVPKKDAEIVTPDHIRIKRFPFVDLRAVSVLRLRIGQPGWSMSVGGTA